jgi:hypothetical protein
MNLLSKTWPFVFVALGLLAAACSQKSAPPGPTPSPAATPKDAAEALARAQDALDRAGGYHVEMTGHNFSLPQWGGIESASVSVNGNGTAATAKVARTGEGSYTVILVDGQTFFQRETCPTWARVSGGAPAVLEVFLWNRTAALRNATGTRLETAGGAFTVHATMGSLGEVAVELDPSTLLPRRLTRPDGLSMTFSDWGKGPSVTRPSGNVPDRGPGGIPC